MKTLPSPLLRLSAGCPLCEQRQRLENLASKCDGSPPAMTTLITATRWWSRNQPKVWPVFEVIVSVPVAAIENRVTSFEIDIGT
jgi:hypothetical protein